jgi:hypothetical protein
LDLLATFDPDSEALLNELRSVPAKGSEQGLLRSRPALLNLDAALAQSVSAGTEVRFSLFDGESLPGSIEKITRWGVLDYSWVGSLSGPEGGRFYMTIKDGVMTAMVLPNDGRLFQVTYAGNGIQEIKQFDANQMGGCAVDDALAGAPAGKAGGSPPPQLQSIGLQTDPSTQFDILIVYTPLARSNAGGTAAIEGEVANAVNLANDAYTNSGINTQMRLIYTGEISYTETTDLSTNLSRLTATADGHMDSVHTLRDQYGADFVALIVNPATLDGCGIAPLITTLNTANAVSAFSVTDRGCIANQTMTHEVGHNMGCQHNREDAGSAGLYSYSYGWRFIGANDSQKYRTIMSYASGSYDPSTRIQYFSNPTVSYQGTATGVAVGQPNESHNAQTVNNAASTFANYRPIAGTITLVPSDSITFDGPWGGPFTTAGDTATLYNVDSSALNWTASVDDSDVSDGGGGFLAPIGVSPTGGMLGAGSNVELTLSPTAEADEMPVGSHEVTLRVDDTTNAEEETLAVILEVRGVDSLEMDPISSPKGVDLPFPVTLAVKDNQAMAVPGFTGTVSLSGQTPGTPGDQTVGTQLAAAAWPLQTEFEVARTQTILQDSQIGLGDGLISAVAIDVNIVPNPTLLRNFTIRMKHTTRDDFFDAPIEGWEPDDWTTVFQNDVTIDSTGWRTFTLDTVFEYDGTSNLMVDFSFQNNGGESNASGLAIVTNSGDTQTLSGNVDNSDGFGAPTSWSGFSPSITAWDAFVTMRLTFAAYNTVAVSPSTSGNFSGGGWTGDVTIGSPYAAIRLNADDGSGHTATSAFFEVTTVDLSTVYVDFSHNGSEIGTQTYPFNTLAEGVSNVDVGGTVIVDAGSTAETMTISKAVRIESNGGTASIGAGP